jgi:hypothetical protein
MLLAVNDFRANYLGTCGLGVWDPYKSQMAARPDHFRVADVPLCSASNDSKKQSDGRRGEEHTKAIQVCNECTSPGPPGSV